MSAYGYACVCLSSAVLFKNVRNVRSFYIKVNALFQHEHAAAEQHSIILKSVYHVLMWRSHVSSSSHLPLQLIHPGPQLYVLLQPAVALHSWYAAAAAAAAAAAVAAGVLWQQLRHVVCPNALHQLLVHCIRVGYALSLLLTEAYELHCKPADRDAAMHCK
jgi:hypothetical protein